MLDTGISKCDGASMKRTELTKLLAGKGMGLSDLAKIMGVSAASVTRWSVNKIPAERVIDVEKSTGISRENLRPDIYRRG